MGSCSSSNRLTRLNNFEIPITLNVINCNETGGLLLSFCEKPQEQEQFHDDNGRPIDEVQTSKQQTLNVAWLEGNESASPAAIATINIIKENPNILSENVFVDDGSTLKWTRYSSGLLRDNSCIETPEQLITGVTSQDVRQVKSSIIIAETRKSYLNDKWIYWGFPVICRFLLTYQGCHVVNSIENNCSVHSSLCASIPSNFNESTCIGDLILTVIGGWNVGDGIKFGVDRLLYRIGATTEHAPYMAMYEWGGGENSMTELRLWGLSRLAVGVKKDLLILLFSDELKNQYSKSCITGFFTWIVERIDNSAIDVKSGDLVTRSTVLPLCPGLWTETKLSSGG